MTEESKEEVKELTTEQKLDALMNGVVANNDLLTRLVAGLDAIVPVISNMLTPQQPPAGPPYPQGYPVQPPQTPPNPQTTPAQFSNRFSEESEYMGAEEASRSSRSYTHMGNVAQQFGQAPANQPPPQQPPPQSQAAPPNDAGERMMTPEEYRNAFPE